MSRNGTLLPIPEGDSRFPELIEAWPDFALRAGGAWPRSAWLSTFERLLREHFPASSSADRKLTARHYAPFPLRDGHDVP